MAESSAEKSFEATPHRRQQAREKGQVAFSQDLGSAVLLLVAAGLLMAYGRGLLEASALVMQRCLGEPVDLQADAGMVAAQGRDATYLVGVAVLPILGFLMLAGIASSVMQTGLLFVPDRIQPDLSRLNPLEGFKRILSIRGTMRLGFGLLKVAIVSAVTVGVLYSRVGEILESSRLDTAALGALLADVTIDTLLWVGLALVILALADFFFQKWKHDQDLRMSHQEIKEEMKNLQGDPQVVARRRQIQRQMLMSRIGQSVPTADVVVTNPTELAVALRYEPETMAAPVVVAKGAGVLAQRIRRLALENGVPVVERKPLAQLLYKEVAVNAPVPSQAYAAVAEVLAYVYRLKGKKVPRPPRVA